MAFKVSPFHKQANGSPFQIKSPLHEVNAPQLKDIAAQEKKEREAKNNKTPKRSYDEAYEKRDQKTYGGMTKEEYVKEAKRQKKSKEEGKGYDAPSKPITKAKVENDKPAETTKVTETKKEEPKTKTGKQRRAEKRVGRLKKKQQKGKKLSASQEKKLARNESKKAGEKVKDEDKTKVGKAIKKGVDKVKEVVKKKKSDNSISDSERADRRKKSGNYNSDGSVKDASERNA